MSLNEYGSIGGDSACGGRARVPATTGYYVEVTGRRLGTFWTSVSISANALSAMRTSAKPRTGSLASRVGPRGSVDTRYGARRESRCGRADGPVPNPVPEENECPIRSLSQSTEIPRLGNLTNKPRSDEAATLGREVTLEHADDRARRRRGVITGMARRA